MSRDKVIVYVEEPLKEALDHILRKKGYRTVAEYIRDCIRRDAERLGFFDGSNNLQEVTA
jgi:metal-responsive CopG/Arc/MetJ family transcriptional regulator